MRIHRVLSTLFLFCFSFYFISTVLLFPFQILCTISRDFYLPLTVIHNSNAHAKSTVDLVPVRIRPFIRLCSIFVSLLHSHCSTTMTTNTNILLPLHKNLIYVDSTQFSILIFSNGVLFLKFVVVAFFFCSLNSAERNFFFFFLSNWKKQDRKIQKQQNVFNIFTKKKKNKSESIFFISCLECKARLLYIYIRKTRIFGV